MGMSYTIKCIRNEERVNKRVNLLDKVEDSDPIPYRGEKASSIRTEQEVTLTVDGSKQIGKLVVFVVSNETIPFFPIERLGGFFSYLKICLHCAICPLCLETVSRKLEVLLSTLESLVEWTFFESLINDKEA